MTDIKVFQENATVAGTGDATAVLVRQENATLLGSAPAGAGEVRSRQQVVYVVGVAPAQNIRAYQEPSVLLGSAGTPQALVRNTVVYLLHGERPATRRLRAWTFSMDGHDFYVLMLGKDGTLIYDVTTGQFSNWESSGYMTWRSNFGLNWENDIIGGDISSGQIFNISADSKRDFGNETIISYVTGFIGHRGRDPLPCYGVTLITSQGDPSDANSGVELRISDDLEQSFWSAGKLGPLQLGVADYDLSWYSLGQIQQPGRIFQLVDYGYADRIDALEFLEGPKGA